MSLEFSMFDNPRPVVAFPWGSKSITKIFLFCWDNPAARLITVVEEQGGTVVGSFTILGNSVEFLEKKPSECLFAADNSVLGAKVGLTG